jgi:recombination protein RecT
MNDLANRMRTQRGELAPNTPRTPDEGRRSLADEIRKMIPDFERAMPRGHDAVQLARDAMTVLRKTPRLAECDPMSVLGGLMTCAQLGLRPAVLGEAWLLPMRNKGRMEATLIIGYPGLINLAYRSDRVVSIEAHKRYESDFFDVRYGTDSRIEHIPSRAPRAARGPVTDYYSVVHLVGGPRPLVSAWTREDCEEHRDKFAMARKNGEIVGPWRDHFDAMALKTTLIDVLKTAPRSTQYVRGLAVDGGVRLDVNPRTDATEVTDAADIVDGDVVEDVEEPDTDAE